MLYKLSILSLVIIFTCGLFETNFLAFRNKIYWHIKNELEWSDFKGFRKPYYKVSSKNFLEKKIENFAFIHSKIIIKQNSSDPKNISIFACFYPARSYVNKPSAQKDSLLRHENYHFHLTEIYARKLRAAVLKGSIFSKEELNKKKDNLTLELEEVHIQYDNETDHSILIDKQIEWEKFIDSTLNTLQKYSDPYLINYHN